MGAKVPCLLSPIPGMPTCANLSIMAEKSVKGAFVRSVVRVICNSNRVIAKDCEYVQRPVLLGDATSLSCRQNGVGIPVEGLVNCM